MWSRRERSIREEKLERGIATELAGEKRAGRARGEDGHEFGLRLLSLRHQFDIQTKMLSS